MMFCPTKTREKPMTMAAKKVFNRVELEEVVAMATSSHKCSEVVVADLEDHRKERVFNMPLRLLSKKYIKVKPAR